MIMSASESHRHRDPQAKGGFLAAAPRKYVPLPQQVPQPPDFGLAPSRQYCRGDSSQCSPCRASRRRKLATIEKLHPGAIVYDVTSKGEEPCVRFSPFYPHGDIPVPNSPGCTAQSVEGVWQGLKVFESEDIDTTKFAVANMKGIKRSVRGRGRVLGHRFGVESDELLTYLDARYRIYLPTYRWVLDNCLTAELEQLRAEMARNDIVLLDYETNADVTDLSKPLSHASLVACYLREEWPEP